MHAASVIGCRDVVPMLYRDLARRGQTVAQAVGDDDDVGRSIIPRCEPGSSRAVTYLRPSRSNGPRSQLANARRERCTAFPRIGVAPCPAIICSPKSAICFTSCSGDDVAAAAGAGFGLGLPNIGRRCSRHEMLYFLRGGQPLFSVKYRASPAKLREQLLDRK